MSKVSRTDPGTILSKAVEYHGFVYLQGVTAKDTSKDIKGPLYLKDAEIVKLECNIHPWMKGFIVVHDPRYCAVSAEDGSFEIKNIPAGTYKVNVFHEKFGNLDGKETHSIEIKAGETKMWKIRFGPKKPKK